MRYGRQKIGPTFGRTLGRLAGVAITCGNRKNYEGYRAAVEEIYQMLDTVAEEAGFEQHFTREKSSDTQPVSVATVAPESKPVTKSARPKSKAPKGAGASGKSRGKSGSFNKGTKRDASSGGAGGPDDSPDVFEPDVPGEKG